jgi:OOP family OmpA-OmpF porin
MYDKSLFTELDTVGSMTFINIEFETGKAVINSESLPLLEQIAATMKSHPNITMEIRGHTDDRGSDALNQTLSKQRAEAVADVLVNLGVPREHLRSKGFGSMQPIVANDSDENRAKNRRTEFVIVAK